LGSDRRRAYLNLLMFASLAMLIAWFILDLLDLYTAAEWAMYTREYREYLFYAAIILNVAVILIRRRLKT